MTVDEAMPHKLDFIRAEIDQLRENNLPDQHSHHGLAADAWMVVDGRRVLNFCTNNYLGLGESSAHAWRPPRRRSTAGASACRSAQHRGHPGAAPRARAPAGQVRGVEDALYVQSDLANQAAPPPARRQGGRHLLRPAELRPGHRRLRPDRLQDHRVRTPRPWRMPGLKIKENLPDYRRSLLGDGRRVQHGRRRGAVDLADLVADRYGVPDDGGRCARRGGVGQGRPGRRSLGCRRLRCGKSAR